MERTILHVDMNACYLFDEGGRWFVEYRVSY